MDSCFELHSNPKIRSFLSPGHRHGYKSFSISNSHKNLRELFSGNCTKTPKQRIKVDQFRRKKLQSPNISSKAPLIKTHQNTPKYNFLQKNDGQQRHQIQVLKAKLKQLELQNQELKFQQSQIEKLIKDKNKMICELQDKVRKHQFRMNPRDFRITSTVRRNLVCEDSSRHLRTNSTSYEEVKHNNQFFESIRKQRDYLRDKCLKLTIQCQSYKKKIEENQILRKNEMIEKKSVEAVRNQLQEFGETQKSFLNLLNQLGRDRNREIDEINRLLNRLN